MTVVARSARGAAVALLVVASACADARAPRAGLTASSTPSVTASAPTASTDPSRQNGTSSERPAPPGEGRPAPTVAPAPPADDGDPGRNAAAYLQGRVRELVVEIDAVPGREPRAETVELVRRRLGAVVDKPGGITFVPAGAAQAGDGAWSVAELQRAERRHRTTHNRADVAGMYLLFVDGAPPKEGAIGLAYGASSIAIFSDEVDDAASLLVTSAEIERAVTVHEVGHLLSLVNLGYASSRDHEDREHRGHSDNPGSVMYWAVDNVGVASLLGGRDAPPTEFDADDLADLAAIRAGKAP